MTPNNRRSSIFTKRKSPSSVSVSMPQRFAQRLKQVMISVIMISKREHLVLSGDCNAVVGDKHMLF